MIKYVRTEDGVMTVDDFVLCLLRKDAESHGKEILNFEKAERPVDKYSTRNFYEFDVCTPSASGHLGIRCDSRHCIMPECDALKMVDETPNRKADAIEELCDEFVYTRTLSDGRRVIRNFKHIIRTKCQADEFCILFTADDFHDIHIAQGVAKQQVENGVYGAIWTDKGLIYVAKMNKKGEFELL